MEFNEFLKVYNSKTRTSEFVSYFNNGKHLTTQENAFLIKEYQKDKEANIAPEDSFARTLLIIGNQNIIHSRMRSFDIENDEDKFGVGLIGLINAIDKFDPEKDTALYTYIYSAVRNALLKNIQQETRNKRTAEIYSLDAPIEEKYEKNFYHYFGEEDLGIKQIKGETSKSLVDNILCHLSQREQFLLMSIAGQYGKEMSKGEICKKLGCSHTSLYTYIDAAKEKARIITTQKQLLTQREKHLQKSILNTTYPIMTQEDYNNYNPHTPEPLPIKIKSLLTFINNSSHDTLVRWLQKEYQLKKQETIDSIEKLSTKNQFFLIDVANLYSIDDNISSSIANHLYKRALKDFGLVYNDRLLLSKEDFDIIYPRQTKLLSIEDYLDYKSEIKELPYSTPLHKSKIRLEDVVEEENIEQNSNENLNM